MKDNPMTVPFTEKAVTAHLDRCITEMRKKRDQANNEEDELVYSCYVDAYQSMRMSLFAALLPEDDA